MQTTTENLIDIFEEKVDSSSDRQAGRVLGKAIVGNLNRSAIWFAEATIKRVDPALDENGKEPEKTLEAFNNIAADEEEALAREHALVDGGMVPQEHPRVTMEKMTRLRNYVQAKLEQVARPQAFGLPSPYDIGMTFERTYDFQTALTASNVSTLGFPIPEKAKLIISAMNVRSDAARGKSMRMLAEQLAPTVGLTVEDTVRLMAAGYLNQIESRFTMRDRVLGELQSVTGGLDNVSATELFDSFPAVRQYRSWVSAINSVKKEHARIAQMLLTGKLPLTHDAVGEMPIIQALAGELLKKLVLRTNDPAFKQEIQESIERGATIPDLPVVVLPTTQAAAA